MPGTFAHFVLVHEAAAALSKAFRQVKIAVNRFGPFTLLGANSPDFPLLDFPVMLFSKKWEDLLHGPTAGAVIEPAISLLRSLSGDQRQICLAWFCGYLSHMVADTTIHPVVNLRVGPYDGNEEPHQTCEIHQDAHIFSRLNIGLIKKAEYMQNVVETCSSPTNRLALRKEIHNFWESMTQSAFPAESLPNFHRWFDAYTGIVDNLAEEDSQEGFLWPSFLRPVAKVLGKAHLLHINPEKIDPSFINDLLAPHEQKFSYDAIFAKAVQNTVTAWQAVDGALSAGGPLPLPLSAQWNLNTGMIDKSTFLYW